MGELAAFTKVTYDARDSDTLHIAHEQLPVFTAQCPEAPTGECHYMEEKGVVDILVTGNVRAPNQQPATSVTVTLQWGNEARCIVARGPRAWEQHAGELRMSAAEPFVELPMSWEMAYGGKHVVPAGFAPYSTTPMPAGESAFSANPEGMGYYLEHDHAAGGPLPQLEDPSDLIEHWNDKPTPVCFSPLPLASSLRMSHIEIDQEAGLVGARHPDELLFARFFQNAPPQQQVQSLEAGTRFRLEGMTFGHPVCFALPPPPVAWTMRTGGRSTSVAPRYKAVHIYPNERKVAVLFLANVYYPLIKHELRVARLEEV